MPNKTVIAEKWRKTAFIPSKSTKKSKAYDIRACIPEGDVVLLPNQGATISTGLNFKIPEEEDVKILSKSGLASKYNVFVLNSPGLIDEDFYPVSPSDNKAEFDVRVILFNAGQEPFVVEHGMKIAQAEVSDKNILVDVDGVEHIEEVERIGGVGSTGL